MLLDSEPVVYREVRSKTSSKSLVWRARWRAQGKATTTTPWTGHETLGASASK